MSEQAWRANARGLDEHGTPLVAVSGSEGMDAAKRSALISAAPALLEALEEILNCQDGIGCRLTPAHDKRARNIVWLAKARTARADRLSAAREGVEKALENLVGAVSPDLYRKAAADHGLASACDDAYAVARAALKELEEAQA